MCEVTPMNYCGHFCDFKFFANYFQLLFVFMKEESFESFKKTSSTWCLDACKPRFDIFCRAVLLDIELLISTNLCMASSSRRMYRTCAEIETIR